LNENKRNQLKKEAAGYNLTPLLVVAGSFGLVLSLYIAYQASISERQLFSVPVFCAL
jgi:hypothetical protein